MPKQVVQIEKFIWRGQERYRCPCFWPNGRPCEFDHYSPDVVLRHMHEIHRSQAEAEATKLHLFGADEDAGETGEEPNIIGARDISAEAAKRIVVPGDGPGDARGKRSRTQL